MFMSIENELDLLTSEMANRLFLIGIFVSAEGILLCQACAPLSKFLML